ncbi:hypothetical protein I4U23_018081 [Adineta vaga]|nr:hypothetical protein I4U23_018081 [Adineta vaga]
MSTISENGNECVSWFVQSYYKPCAATVILNEPIIQETKNSMTQCKVRLCGLKPNDINYNTNSKITEIPAEYQQEHLLSTPSSIDEVNGASLFETDYLNLHIKPIAKSADLDSSFSGNSDTHESTPIRVTIRETPRGRHHIRISQTLLRSNQIDV